MAVAASYLDRPAGTQSCDKNMQKPSAENRSHKICRHNNPRAIAHKKAVAWLSGVLLMILREKRILPNCFSK